MKEKIQEVIDDKYLDLCLDGLLAQEAYEIRIKHDFNTACWCFRDEKHIIFIGDNILDNCKKISDEESKEYIASYLYHEVAHSVHTQRELESINLALSSNKIPFSLFNLAEDARIESLMRIDSSREFKWAKYEELLEAINPVEKLFLIIQNDGDSTFLKETSIDKKVIEYYESFCKADNSMHIVEILINWMKEFKDTDDELNNLQNKLSSSDQEQEINALEDLKYSLLLANNEELFQEMTKGSLVVNSNANEEDISSCKAELNTVSLEENSNARVALDKVATWDSQLAKELAELFSKTFMIKKGYVKTKKSSKRINAKAFRQGAYTDKYFKRKETKSQVKKRVAIILDCSGSMYSQMKEMRVVIGVFNELSKNGIIEGTVTLSGVQDSTAIHETFRFPIEDEVIGTFHGKYGAEGIESAMKENINLLVESDYIFVLTDGDIWDAPIDKEFYHNKGLYTIGIYIGNPDKCNLNKWFDKGVSVQNTQNCVDELVSIIGEDHV